MFDWFGKVFGRRDYIQSDKSDLEKIADDMKKVIPPVPTVEPEKPVHTFYRLGLTDNNRVSFQMGYSEITMNSQGIDTMIELLRVYQSKLEVVETDNEQ